MASTLPLSVGTVCPAGVSATQGGLKHTQDVFLVRSGVLLLPARAHGHLKSGTRLQYSNRPFPPLYTHRTRTRTARPQATSAGARRRLLSYTNWQHCITSPTRSHALLPIGPRLLHAPPRWTFLEERGCQINARVHGRVQSSS